MNNLKSHFFYLNYLFVRPSGTGRFFIVTLITTCLIICSQTKADTLLSLTSQEFPDAPKVLPVKSLNPLDEKIYWQNYAIKLFHGEEPVQNQLNEIFETSETSLAEELNHALKNAKIEEWFF